MAETRKRKTGRASEVAAILGVRDSTVSRWKNEADFPPANDGLFVLDDVFRWYYRREHEKELAETLMDSQGGQSEGLERYRLAKAQMAEIELAKVRCEIVSLHDCEEAMPIVFAPWRRVAEHCKQTENHEMMEMIEEANASVLAGLERFCSGFSNVE
jgi:phage terminase Nu1 subunit (DNA packaging protein)